MPALHGILPKQNNIIRPLLFTRKNDIVNYLKANNILWRDDSSNTSLQFQRNRIRHELLPLLNELNPSFLNGLKNTIEHISDAEKIYNYTLEKKRAKVISNCDDRIIISLSKLKKLKPLKAYTFEFLSPYGFNSSQISDIISSFFDISGKQFYSHTHRLIKDRNQLITTPNKESDKNSEEIIINQDTIIINAPVKLRITNHIYERITELEAGNTDFPYSKEKNVANLDRDKLTFPLTIRKWEHGDYFYPFGMNKKQKLSKFFINSKFSIADKESAYVLCSDNKIIWIIGHRIDNRFRITDKTKNVYTITLIRDSIT